METKRCSRCGEFKLLSEFNLRLKSGWQPYCRVCQSEWNTKHNPERTSEDRHAENLRTRNPEMLYEEGTVWSEILRSYLTCCAISNAPNDLATWYPEKGTMELGHVDHVDRELSRYKPMCRWINRRLSAFPAIYDHLTPLLADFRKEFPWGAPTWAHTGIDPDTHNGIGGVRDASPFREKINAKKMWHENRRLERLHVRAEELYQERIAGVLARRALEETTEGACVR